MLQHTIMLAVPSWTNATLQVRDFLLKSLSKELQTDARSQPLGQRPILGWSQTQAFQTKLTVPPGAVRGRLSEFADEWRRFVLDA